MNFEEIEERLVRMTGQELISFCFEKDLLKRTVRCEGSCESLMVFKKCSASADGFVWRCMISSCSLYLKRISIRIDSFFASFKHDILKILKILLRYASNQCRSSMLLSINVSKPFLIKVLDHLIHFMILSNENNRKIGGANTVVQVDETMLNYKCKSHRGRSPNNRTDALCIVECAPHITQVWCQVIPNKKMSTLIPIIINHVEINSIIYTDEHASYSSLMLNGFFHETVCHKFNFVNPINSVHTQHVESFNNASKYEIKKLKEIQTNKREQFLSEFMWKWNNKNNLLDAIFLLIKV